jgi:Cu-processing system ATP-binding protein
VISFRAFTKRYGTQPAVVDLHFEVGAHEVVALLGPNGSGKTTCLKAAAGLVVPTSGEVRIGAGAQPAASPAARAVLSFLPQKVSFPEALTGQEVLEFYRSLRAVAPPRVGEVLRFASLNGSSGRAVGLYSGGMVQRLGLAVAMLPDAPVLLLDEPTAALDPEGLAAFYQLVTRRREEGKTILFTSHHLGDAERLADRFAVLVGGRLVACLGAEELRTRLAERGLLRLALSAPVAGLLDRLRRLEPRAEEVDGVFIVPGPAERRPAVLDAVRAAGGEIRRLTTEDGHLDELYRELVAARP